MLIEQALKLLEKGIHPLKIANGFDKASDAALLHLESLKENQPKTTREELIESAKIALSSKVVSQCKEHLAEIAVDAVLKVADLERKEVNFDLIKIIGKPGRSLKESQLVEGILIDKEFSHP